MKTALVTGAAGGIGHAICAVLAQAGYRVIGTDKKGAQVGEMFVEADLSDARSISSLRRAVGERLDLLVNNAAVQRVAPTADVTAQDWDETLRVNLTAPFRLVQALLPQLSLAGGCVVNVASIHGALTKPGFVAYATSKAALLGLTRALAVDLGGRVRVNAVCPAAIDTHMLRDGFGGNEKLLTGLAANHPAGTIGTPAEVARAVLWLAEAGPFVTGTVVALDGGIGSRLHDVV